MMTDEDCVAACRNIGYDLTCGACAEVFYTGGSWGAEHEPECATIPALKVHHRVTITSEPLEKKLLSPT